MLDGSLDHVRLHPKRHLAVASQQTIHSTAKAMDQMSLSSGKTGSLPWVLTKQNQVATLRIAVTLERSAYIIVADLLKMVIPQPNGLKVTGRP